MQNRNPRYTDESTTDLVVGLVGDARDLALVHLNRMTRELKSELGNLGDLIKARALSLAGLLVAAVLAAQAVAFGLADALHIPLWASFGVMAVLVILASAIYKKKTSKPSHEVDLVPENALDDAKQDAVKLLSGDAIKAVATGKREDRLTAD